MVREREDDVIGDAGGNGPDKGPLRMEREEEVEKEAGEDMCENQEASKDHLMMMMHGATLLCVCVCEREREREREKEKERVCVCVCASVCV